MKKIIDIADKVFCGILFLATGAMLVIGTAQVFWRFVLHSPLSWSEELLRYLYVWATLLGIGVGIHRGAFTTVTIFSDWVQKKSRLGGFAIQILSLLAQIVFFVILTCFGFKLAQRGLTQLSPTMRIPMGLVYAVQPVGGVLGVIYSIIKLADLILRGGKTE